MGDQRSFRYILRFGAAFNFAAASMLLFPESAGAVARLPPAGSVFYTWLLVLFIALFGGAYGWLSFQARISRSLIGMAAIGKIGVFFVALACWGRGELAAEGVAPAIVDLAFGFVFVWWLRQPAEGASHRRAPPPQP